MTLKWPEPMPDNGRLSQSDDAWMTGLMRVIDAKMSCQQTLNGLLMCVCVRTSEKCGESAR